MENGLYQKRYIDKQIENALRSVGCVFLKGPRWTGKTTTCRFYANSVLDLSDEDVLRESKFIAGTKVATLLAGENPRLIDEWQTIPALWGAIRHDVDRRNASGLYLITGSITPPSIHKNHSGTGRILPLTMHPLSSYESGDSNGLVSLSSILSGDIPAIETVQSPHKNIYDIAYLICRGGWPRLFHVSKEDALLVAGAFVKGIYENESDEFKWISKRPALAKDLLIAYAKAISTTTLESTLTADLAVNYNVSERTVKNYLADFGRLFITRTISSWNLAVRSRSARRSAPKRDFVDPSIATAVLELTPEQLPKDPFYFGLLFESFVRRDLIVYLDYVGGTVRHFRNRHGLECDNVLVFPDGSYALVEVKLSLDEVLKGVEQLLRIKGNLVATKRALPRFMMIITSLGSMSIQKDGILVVPIGCLRA